MGARSYEERVVRMVVVMVVIMVVVVMFSGVGSGSGSSTGSSLFLVVVLGVAEVDFILETELADAGGEEGEVGREGDSEGTRDG
jgi:hypothetical protein